MASVRNTFDHSQRATNFLNHIQNPVMEAGLPLFAIAKQIQHKFPNENGKDIYFWFREGHLEKAPFNI